MHLADGRISETIPVLPFPYGRPQAEWWVQHRTAFRQKWDAETTFAIRRPCGQLVGSVGVDDYPVGSHEAAELGYWIAAAERGRGLATIAALAFVAYSFSTLKLNALTARTLSCNPASAHVLKKLGFELTAVKEKYTTTRAGTFDTLFYRLDRDRVPNQTMRWTGPRQAVW